MESLISRMRAALDCGSLMAPIVPVRQDRPVTRTLQELLDGLDDPGAAACVVRDGDITDEAVTGTLDGTRPWATDTLVMTYSCAKPFAALTVLTAVAEGALGLDQPVADLWPAYAAHGKQATTVRHVLATRPGCRRSRRPPRTSPSTTATPWSSCSPTRRRSTNPGRPAPSTR